MSALVIAVIGFACFLAGLGIAYWFIKTDSDINAEKAENLRTEFDTYKSDVSQHFTETARHFQAIGDQYRALYNHMADGAENLLGLEGEEAQRQFALLAPAAAAAETTAADAGEVIESAAIEPEVEAEDGTIQAAIDDGEITAEAASPEVEEEAPVVEAEAESTEEIAEEEPTEEAVAEVAAAEAEEEAPVVEAEAEAPEAEEAAEDDTVEMKVLDASAIAAESDDEASAVEGATVHVLHKAKENAA